MLTISKASLRTAIHAHFWPGYKLPLFFAVISLIGILVVLTATLTALLILNRRLKQKHLKKISIGDDHLLHINKNILFISPPESDPESDILFDKNRDVIQPKFRRFTASLLSKFTQPFIKEPKVRYFCYKIILINISINTVSGVCFYFQIGSNRSSTNL